MDDLLHVQGVDVPCKTEGDYDFCEVEKYPSDGDTLPHEAYGPRAPRLTPSFTLDPSSRRKLTKQVSKLGIDAFSTAANALSGTASLAQKSFNDFRSSIAPPVAVDGGSTGIRDTDGSIKEDNRWWIDLRRDARLRTNLLEKLARPYDVSRGTFYPCPAEEPEEKINEFSAWKFDRSQGRIAYTEVSRPFSNTPLAIPDELLYATCICGNEMMLKNKKDDEGSKEYLNGERWFYSMLEYDQDGKEQKRFARMEHQHELDKYTTKVSNGFELANSIGCRYPDDSTEVQSFIEELDSTPRPRSSSFVSDPNRRVKIPSKKGVEDQSSRRSSAANASEEVKEKKEEEEEESQTSCFSSRAHKILDGNENDDDPIFHLDRGNTPN